MGSTEVTAPDRALTLPLDRAPDVPSPRGRGPEPPFAPLDFKPFVKPRCRLARIDNKTLDDPGAGDSFGAFATVGRASRCEPVPTSPPVFWGAEGGIVHGQPLTLPVDRAADRLDGSDSRPGWSLWDEALVLVTRELYGGTTRPGNCRRASCRHFFHISSETEPPRRVNGRQRHRVESLLPWASGRAARNPSRPSGGPPAAAWEQDGKRRNLDAGPREPAGTLDGPGGRLAKMLSVVGANRAKIQHRWEMPVWNCGSGFIVEG